MGKEARKQESNEHVDSEKASRELYTVFKLRKLTANLMQVLIYLDYIQS